MKLSKIKYRVYFCTILLLSFCFSSLSKSLSPPDNFSSDALTFSKVQLTWKQISLNADYRIERSLDSVNYVKIADISSGTTEYIDRQCGPGLKYFYRISSVYNGSVSEFSPVRSAVTKELLYPNMYGIFQNYPNSTGGASIESCFELYAQNNIQYYFINAGSNGIAFYPSDIVERYSPTDYVQQAIDLGKKYGVGIQLWHQCFYLKGAKSDVIDRFASERRSPVDSKGNVRRGYLNPILKSNRDLDLSVIEELVTKYPQADAINIDYLRYIGTQYDFSTGSKEEFEKQTGILVSNWPSDVIDNGKYASEYVKFREDIMTNHVEDIYELVKSINPDIIVTADVFPFKEWAAYQQWDKWVEDGIMDVVLPMTYYASSDGWWPKAISWQKEVTEQTKVAYYTLIGTINNQGQKNPANNMLQQVIAIQNNKNDGFAVFSNGTHFRDNFIPLFKSQILSRWNPSIPASPSELQLTNKNDSYIQLNWVDNAHDENGFLIEKSNDGENYYPVGATAPSVTFYRDKDIVTGNNYYRVRAYNSKGKSAWIEGLISIDYDK